MLRENEIIASATRNNAVEVKNERERRRALGIYYTPAEAAEILARWVIQSPEEILLEPSFGGCSMLSAAVSVFHALGNEKPSAQLYGFDIDEKAFEHLAEMGIDNSAGQFKKGDFLVSTAGGVHVSAILANPPFVSYHRQSEDQRRVTEQIRQRYFPQLPKLASLWAFFVLHSMSFLLPGGRMAFVLPNAVGTTDYGRTLLDHLSTKFEKVELVHVTERIFVQTGTDERIALLLLSGYTQSGVSPPAALQIRHIARMSELEMQNCGGDEMSETLVEPSSAGTKLLSSLFSKSFIELGEIASISIGEVVGDVRFFVKTKAEWKSLGIMPKYLFPLLNRAAQINGLAVTENDVDAKNSPIPYLLLPPKKRMPQAITEHILKYEKKDIDENRTFEKRDIWYRCSYETTADAFIGSMNHEYPRVIGNEASISCSNSFYKIKIAKKKEYSPWLSIISLTTPFRLSAEIMGRIRGSGGFKLEPSDVRNLLIPRKLPTVSAKEMKVLKEKINLLVCQGEIAAAGDVADDIFYLNPKIIDVDTMIRLREQRLALTTRRLGRSI